MTFPLGFAENSIQLVPDGTLILHVIIILVMVFILNATLYKPINRILAAREKRTRGRMSEAQQIMSDVSERVSNYEKQLRQARAEAYALSEAERSAAMQERQRNLNQMRQQLAEELAKAQQERDAALAKLKEVEERLARLDSEIGTIQEQSKREAAEERQRIAKSTEVEITKLGEQAQREIESAGKAARHELRRYAAQTSVELAEKIIRREMNPEDDARLIQRNVQELGGAPQ